MCRGCGGMYGDPWNGMSIGKGVLTVTHYGGSAWRWTDQQKFRFQNNAMYLIGSTDDHFWINPDGKGIGNAGRRSRDVNWVTGEEEVIERADSCKLITHTRKKIKIEPLVKLEQFKNK